MILGCTYAIDIELDDPTIDLSASPHVYVTLGQGSLLKTFTGDRLEISGHELSVYLTQEETLAFKPGAVQLQVNWLTSDGAGGYYRSATDTAAVIFGKQLLRRVLPTSSEVR